MKEQIIPSQSTKSLFFLAPMISLIFSLLGWGVIPFGPGLALSDFSLGILYSLALSSIGVYGILFAGWSANSKYAFLGALRSTAQMISYELIYSAAVLSVILLCGTFNITGIIEAQQSVWYVVPLLPIFLLFFVSALAETNRTPFDMVEAESELVAGFMTEHSGIIFVFFFLAEYCSIVLMSTFTAILFLGGYNMPEVFSNSTFVNFQGFILGIKAVLFMFVFVWIRATLPRIRYDQLMVFCWTSLLPMAVALLILVPSLLMAFDISPASPFFSTPLNTYYEVSFNFNFIYDYYYLISDYCSCIYLSFTDWVFNPNNILLLVCSMIPFYIVLIAVIYNFVEKCFHYFKVYERLVLPFNRLKENTKEHGFFLSFCNFVYEVLIGKFIYLLVNELQIVVAGAVAFPIKSSPGYKHWIKTESLSNNYQFYAGSLRGLFILTPFLCFLLCVMIYFFFTQINGCVAFIFSSCYQCEISDLMPTVTSWFSLLCPSIKVTPSIKVAVMSMLPILPHKLARKFINDKVTITACHIQQLFSLLKSKNDIPTITQELLDSLKGIQPTTIQFTEDKTINLQKLREAIGSRTSDDSKKYVGVYI